MKVERLLANVGVKQNTDKNGPKIICENIVHVHMLKLNIMSTT